MTMAEPAQQTQQQAQQQAQARQERAEQQEQEATALLSTYLEMPLPYTPDDWGRVECEGCHSNKRFYCPTCLRIVGAPEDAQPVPQLSLPIRIDLVLADYRKKSTGIQAATIAPGSMHIHTFPKEIPEDWDPDKSLVIFPTEDAVTLDAMDPQELAGIERFVLIDSRWNNTTRVLEHASVKWLTRKVKLRAPPSQSRFWRYHSAGEGHLSSIEALYFLLKEYEALTGKGATWAAGHASSPQPAPLEELFFLFRIQLRVIKEHYEKDDKRQGVPMPMDEAGKTRLRNLRNMQGLPGKEKKRQRIAARAAERKRRWEMEDAAKTAAEAAAAAAAAAEQQGDGEGDQEPGLREGAEEEEEQLQQREDLPQPYACEDV